MSEFDEHDGPTSTEETMSRRDFLKRAGAAGALSFIPFLKDNKNSLKNKPANTHNETTSPNTEIEKSSFLSSLENISPSEEEASRWNNLNMWIQQNMPIHYMDVTMAQTSNVQTFIQTDDIIKHRGMTLATMYGSKNPFIKMATTRYNDHPENLRTVRPDNATVQMDYIGNANEPISTNGLQDAINIAGFEAYVNTLDSLRKDLLAKGETEDNIAQAIIQFAHGDGRLQLANAFFKTRVEAYLSEERLLRNTDFGKPLTPPEGTEEYLAADGNTNSPEWIEKVSSLAGLTHTL